MTVERYHRERVAAVRQLLRSTNLTNLLSTVVYCSPLLDKDLFQFVPIPRFPHPACLSHLVQVIWLGDAPPYVCLRVVSTLGLVCSNGYRNGEEKTEEEWDALARLPGGPLSPVQPPNHLRVPLPREREGEDIVRVPNATLLASYRSSRPQEPRNPTVPSRPQTPTSPTAPDDTLTPYRPMGSIWHLVLMRHNAMVRSLLQTSEPAPVNITPEQIVLAAPARPQPQPRFSATHTNPEPIRPLPPFRPRVLTRAPASNAYTRYNRVLANNRFMQLARPPALDMNPEPIRPLPPTRYRGLIRAPASNAYTEYNRVLANNRFMQLARPLALDMNPEPIRPLPPTRYRGLTRAPASNAYTSLFGLCHQRSSLFCAGVLVDGSSLFCAGVLVDGSSLFGAGVLVDGSSLFCAGVLVDGSSLFCAGVLVDGSSLFCAGVQCYGGYELLR
ncbi:unnamed protein product [Chrysodeixis includens]|uniref:Uncharacterized protein n=1 Tax=Chrysodeixis includens TaxID=689277 RepID=A0A9N8PY42_CHRIL|nr:unnamed protein product [Chrysodeixis includens]